MHTYPVYQMVKKVEKLLVEECEVFWKDQNEIGCIECLKLKLNFTGDTPVSQTYRKVSTQIYSQLKQCLEDLLTNQWIKKILFLLR